MRLFARRKSGRGKAQMRKAVRLLQRGKHPEAVEMLKELQTANPDNAAVALNLGAAHYHLGQHTQAIEQFQRGVELEPENARAWLNLAAAYNALGHIDRAEEALGRLGEINSDHPDRHYNLAILYLKRRKTLKAMAELELELAVSPGHALAGQLLQQLHKQLIT